MQSYGIFIYYDNLHVPVKIVFLLVLVSEYGHCFSRCLLRNIAVVGTYKNPTASRLLQLAKLA